MKRVIRLLVLLGTALAVPNQLPAADSRPNFIVFVADDAAWNDIGCYGNLAVRTPNLDRLARQGMRFTQAMLTTSSCSPSRCSILTGRYPHATGAEQLHWPLPAGQVTFVELLRRHGYWTCSAGKWHLGPAAVKKFDRVIRGVKNNPWLRALRQRPRGKPFFLWAAFVDPHRPYQPGAVDPPHKPEEVVVPPFLPDVPEVRRDLALYYDEISRMDQHIGQVLEELQRQGVAEETFVLFISDNGRPFPRCKTTLYHSGIKTPWIVRYPKLVRPGSVTGSLVSAVDIAPTILELAGVPVPETVQGRSFVPVLKDPGATIRRCAFAEQNWHDFTAHRRAVYDGRYKYIWNAYPELPMTPPADAVASPTYQAMLRLHARGKLRPEQATCFRKPSPREELYDTQADPYEMHNLAGDPRYRQVLKRLRRELQNWKQATGDRVPRVRTPDEFDRTTGRRLPGKKPGPRRPRPGQAVRPDQAGVANRRP